MDAVRVCSLGQITQTLVEVGGTWAERWRGQAAATGATYLPSSSSLSSR
jgi:hypothetical protein